ncbi:hypothetical protein BAUCODRAFT_28500 [Baudoinia panamericana UAMH 10762]|uniref:Uncharacterized protein n=1 Tax=Baudoinia panamericana (strain UAMH 10762) TaxID=717646 RepID=M2MJD0_BAUPA|nr:uncharacterized protein BAUCODRAFT_28500 [Baudoinia panamericana UAMH 10762]EMC91388.1 hypothetical protein BAUCODRAFT_28500 [Baudoinia panamericana UAMH 10762]
MARLQHLLAVTAGHSLTALVGRCITMSMRRESATLSKQQLQRQTPYQMATTDNPIIILEDSKVIELSCDEEDPGNAVVPHGSPPAGNLTSPARNIINRNNRGDLYDMRTGQPFRVAISSLLEVTTTKVPWGICLGEGDDNPEIHHAYIKPIPYMDVGCMNFNARDRCHAIRPSMRRDSALCGKLSTAAPPTCEKRARRLQEDIREHLIEEWEERFGRTYDQVLRVERGMTGVTEERRRSGGERKAEMKQEVQPNQHDGVLIREERTVTTGSGHDNFEVEQMHLWRTQPLLDALAMVIETIPAIEHDKRLARDALSSRTPAFWDFRVVKFSEIWATASDRSRTIDMTIFKDHHLEGVKLTIAVQRELVKVSSACHIHRARRPPDAENVASQWLMAIRQIEHDTALDAAVDVCD